MATACDSAIHRSSSDRGLIHRLTRQRDANPFAFFIMQGGIARDGGIAVGIVIDEEENVFDAINKIYRIMILTQRRNAAMKKLLDRINRI